MRAAAIAAAALAGLALAAAAAPGAPRVLYVGPGGRDTGPGTRARPWGSPGAASRRLRPGDTLVILPGRYLLRRDEDILSPPSGRDGAWITIRGEPGLRPVLAGRDDLAAAIDLAGRSYVRVEHLEITHDPDATGEARRFRDGIQVLGRPGRQLMLHDLYIHHIDEMGLNMGDAEDVTVRDSRLEYCGFGGIGGPAGEHGGWRHVRVQGCTLSYGGHYYRGGDGHDRPYDRPDGLGAEAAAGPLEIVTTVAEHNYGDGLDSKVANTRIDLSVAANNSCDGMKLWGDGSSITNSLVYGTGDGKGGESSWAGIVIDQIEKAGARFSISNVTVHDNPGRRNYPMYIQYDGRAPISLTLRSTIIAGGYGPVFIGPTVTLTAEHNLFYAPDQAEQIQIGERYVTGAELEAGALGPGNLSRDPLFAGPAWGTPGDYHLQPGSPAIDAGAPAGAPAIDLEGQSRPQGPAPDIGAYESGPSAGR